MPSGCKRRDPDESSEEDDPASKDGLKAKLTEYRRVTVREFKGKTLIDIREYYQDKASGDMRPGSKGIALTKEQWASLRANVATIDSMIAKMEDS